MTKPETFICNVLLPHAPHCAVRSMAARHRRSTHSGGWVVTAAQHRAHTTRQPVHKEAGVHKQTPIKNAAGAMDITIHPPNRGALCRWLGAATVHPWGPIHHEGAKTAGSTGQPTTTKHSALCSGSRSQAAHQTRLEAFKTFNTHCMGCRPACTWHCPTTTITNTA